MMSNFIIRAIKRITPQRERRCPLCKRNMDSAIEEQLKIGECCPTNDCAFKKEIWQAILETKTPEVIKWSIDKNKIFENEDITLSWEVLYAKKIEISGIGEVQEKGERKISPRRSVTYTLTIQDHNDKKYEVENPIEIVVIPKAEVEIVEEKMQAEEGDPVVLRWTSQNVGKISLAFDNKVIDVSNLKKYTVKPFRHTTYTLSFTALDEKTVIEKSIEIEVFPKARIVLFEVSPEVVISSVPVTISWKVKNAKKIEINNGVGEVGEEGHKNFLHDHNTLYQITAWGELSTVTKEVVVKIFPTPIIESLFVPAPDFESRITLNKNRVKSPIIDFSINMPAFNLNPPQFTEPENNLKEMKPLYKNKLSIFNFSKIYEYITRNSRT